MRRDVLVTGTLLVAGMLTVMSGAIIAPALPAIAAYFADARQNDMMARLFLVMPALGIVLAAPLVGGVADRYGCWQTLAGSILVLVVSGTSGYGIASYPLLLLSRFLVGCAIAGTTTSATALLGALPEAMKRQDLLGKQSSFTNMAGLTYLFLGGLLATVHWRLPFLLYLWPVVYLPFVVLSMRAQPLMQHAGVRTTQASLAEFRHSPALPVTLLVWTLGCLAMIMIYSLFTAHPFRLREMGIEDPRLVSLTIIMATAASAVTGWNLRRISQQFSSGAIFALTFLMFGLGFFVVSMAQVLWHVLCGNLLIGVGMGLPVPNGAAWLSGIAPDNFRGRILGVFNTFIFLGQFLSAVVIRLVEYLTPHIYVSYAILGGVCVGLAGILALGGRYRNWSASAQEPDDDRAIVR